jgi:iron complex outermembrane receptor protein
VNNKIKLIGRLSALLLPVPFVVNCALAQQEGEDVKAKADNRLEEVVVTARRKSESLQQVPTMVTAVTGEDLDKYGISSIEDLEMTTPGLVYADGVGHAFPYIRGIGSNAFSPAVDPTVGTFLDGFYSPSAVGSLQYIGDVESVQVLKGPQGTLFGRNTTAGAIVINTKKPSEYLQGSI